MAYLGIAAWHVNIETCSKTCICFVFTGKEAANSCYGPAVTRHQDGDLKFIARMDEMTGTFLTIFFSRSLHIDFNVLMQS